LGIDQLQQAKAVTEESVKERVKNGNYHKEL